MIVGMKVKMLLFAVMALMAGACHKDPPVPEPEHPAWENEAGDSVIIASGRQSEFVIVGTTVTDNANGLAAMLKDRTETRISVVKDGADEKECEILVGDTSRKETKDALAALGSDRGYIIRIDGSKLVIAGTDDTWTALALHGFASRILKTRDCLKGENLLLPKDFQLTDRGEDPQLIARMIKNKYKFTLTLHYVMQCPPVDDIYVAQGAASDGKHFYFAMRNSGDTKTIVYKYSMSTLQLVGQSPEFNGGHANDMTFDTAGGRVIVAHGQTQGRILTPLDGETLEVRPNINISVGGGAITYSPARNAYSISQGGSTFFVLDADFKLKVNKNRTDSTPYTAQGMGSDESYVYFPMSGSKDNVLVVYDWDGNYVTTLTVPTATESESMFYAAGKYYVNFYGGASVGGRLYEIRPVHYYSY